MREILFRGKRVRDGEWKYGYYATVVLNGKLYSAIDTVFNNRFVTPTTVYPETVGQYTGLKDQNGKRIFEGDIVQYQPEYEPAPLRSFVVYFADKYNYPAFDLAEHNYEANGLQCAHEEGGCEVIGTIYDNPELLEVER